LSETIKLHNFYNHLSRFTCITAKEFEKCLPYFSNRTLKKGDTLIKPGEKVFQTNWVIKGLLISTFTDNNGKEHVIQFANEGCWITDPQAFYLQQRAIFNITCLEQTELISISFDNREKLCNAISGMEHFFRIKANDSFVKQQKRLLTFLSNDATERFNLLLKEYPDLLQRVSKKILASYLGVSRETLSRLKK